MKHTHLHLKSSIFSVSAVILLLTWNQTSTASELLHQFVNPSFGGNPGNSSHLLGLASAQNKFQDDGQNAVNPLDEFNERLQRSLLGRITSAVTRDIVDNDGNITPGTFDTLDYTINVIDEGNGLVTIETIDKVTGDRTVIQVQNDVPSE